MNSHIFYSLTLDTSVIILSDMPGTDDKLLT